MSVGLELLKPYEFTRNLVAGGNGMRCPECNKEINDNAKFCKYCGKKIEDNNSISGNSEEIPVEEPLFIACPNCGREMQEDKAFCTNCGNPLNGAVTKEEILDKEKPNTPKRKSFKVILCLVALLIIGGAVIAAKHFLKFNDNESDRAVEKTDESGREDDEDVKSVLGGEEKDSSAEETEPGVDAEAEILKSNDSQSDNVIEKADENGREDDAGIEDASETNEKDSSAGETELEVDVEIEITGIREIYNTIVSGMENNEYEQKTIEDGFVTYSDNNGLRSIVISKDYSEINYACFYYFNDDKLIFAYYEGENSHRFYFKDDRMIRWRKCEDAENSEEGTNHDMEDTAEYLQWESTVQQNAKALKLAWNAADTFEGGDGYILPGSDTKTITKSELDRLSKEEVKLARNEIYARHGRKFDDESLTAYFSQFDWYHPTIEPEDFQESMLNSYEVANRDFIVAYEEEKGYR